MFGLVHVERDHAHLLIKHSASPYAQTLRALIEAIEERELTVFARIDHAAGARAVGLELEEEAVVLFGSPVSGTPLIQSDRRIGIELPLRMLVWQEGEQALLAYRDPRQLSAGYEVGAQLPTLERMATLLERLAAQAAGQR